jgi:CTP synthase (UTP-ammonia lyase)
MKNSTLIALVGDSGAGRREEAAYEALEHSSAALGTTFQSEWLETQELASASALRKLQRFDGFWIVPGSPYRSLDGVLAAIRYAREEGTPLLGTCAGFQHLILEYVRNVLGFHDAVHAEYDPGVPEQAISRLACSLVGQTQRINIDPNSKLASFYGRTTSEEKFHCNYGLNPAYAARLDSGDLTVVGWDSERQPRAVELAGHPFFVGSLFIPQYTSTSDAPHPLVSGFLKTSVAGLPGHNEMKIAAAAVKDT